MDQHVSSWKRTSGYIWALIGSAVGFANILSFSSKAYFYGGGAFLVPFLVALFVLGIPLLYLEGIVGQHFHFPLVASYGEAKGKIGKFFGWLAIIAVTTIGGYYILLTGWTVAYMYFSATNSIPEDSGSFLTNTFLGRTNTIYEWGSFSYTPWIAALVVAFFAWLIVSRNIQSGIERTCSIFLPLLAIMVSGFTIIVCFLPGAWTGFYYYLMPDFSVLKNPRLWLDAFGHIFFSLSLGLGIITGYSRYAGKHINIAQSMRWVAFGDFIISFIAGFAIFGCVGYLSAIKNIPFQSIVTTASPFEMGFVIFPTILKLLGPIFARVAGPLFFFSIFIAGVTGVFSIIESVAGNIEIEFKKSRFFSVTIATSIMFALTTLFCMGNGQHIIGALDPMVAGFNMLISGLAEIVIFIWLSSIVSTHEAWFTKGKKHNAAYLCVRYIAPILLLLVFGLSLFQEFNNGFKLAEYLRWSWLIVATLIACLLTYSSKENK